MEPEAPLEFPVHQSPRHCPTCNTTFSVGDENVGCPVCLFRRALDPESEGDRRPVQTEAFPSEEGRFDHYELVRRDDDTFDELGRGAMGVTYRAVDTILGNAVALKVIDARFAAQPKARERFLREARTAARLRHPNVASVFYYGMRKSDDQCFYAMELIEGETLGAHLRRLGPLAPALALEVLTQVARAMVAAEAQGLVHRDLKPANLMLAHGPEINVKVIDFGLAKAVASPDADITLGGFVGTPAFASPEQFIGTAIDIRSDLYSLGVTLWEMLTGRLPYSGSTAEVRYQHQHAALPLEQLEGVPQPMVALLEVLLEKDPARRFQSPTELLKAIPVKTGVIDNQRTTASLSSPRTPAVYSQGTSRDFSARPRPEKISVARLPVTGSDVFGREEELAFLDAAWANQKTNVVTIVAWAGVGKSTLVNHWLRRMASEDYRSAELVFGWSFYRQGSSGVTSSADEFLDAALTWLGDPDARIGTDWEKGQRLAKLIVDRRTLLILDGLEPLQNPPGSYEGRLREPSLQALLRELAAFNQGLCVITTRLPIADIVDHEHTSAPRRDLEQLSGDAGAKLLRALGVRGADDELRASSEEFGGHCLGLTLLGSYLSDAYDGDIRCRQEVSQRLSHDVRQGVQARKVMESYQTWFGEGPELSLLRMLGLFDRPADEKVIGALLNPPTIPGITESLTGLSPVEWRIILAKLRRARLLAGEDPYHRGYLDTHPLVREFFGNQLRCQRPAAWQECHRRLYHHYRTLTSDRPESFREMEPLFLAAISGCQAGFFRDVLNQIYIPQIQRGNASFAAKALGARGALLSVLGHFFEDGRWGSLRETTVEGQSLTAEDQVFLLIEAGLHLTISRGLGAPEAQVCYRRAEPLCRSLDRPLLLHLALTGQWRYSFMTERLSATMRIAQRVYSLAQEQNDAAFLVGAHRALTFTFYFMGDFKNAREHATRGVQIWDAKSGQARIVEVNEPGVSCLIFQAMSNWHFGEFASCRAAMAQAIFLAKELNDMHGLAVALIFEGILAHLAGDCAEVERLASEVIAMSTRQNFAMWMAAGTVLRGWARSALGDTALGISLINEGIEDFRKTGSILMVPYCLALKAEALHLAERTSDALESIEEAEALVERSEERWWGAELQRLRGVFLRVLRANQSQVELSFRTAIRTAREQNSTSLTARAEASYAGPRSG